MLRRNLDHFAHNITQVADSISVHYIHNHQHCILYRTRNQYYKAWIALFLAYSCYGRTSHVLVTDPRFISYKGNNIPVIIRAFIHLTVSMDSPSAMIVMSNIQR